MTLQPILTGYFTSGIAAAGAATVLPPHLPSPAGPGRTFVLGCGKAAAAMAAVARAHAGPAVTGCVVTRHGHGLANPIPDIAVIEAGHPVPDAASAAAAERIMALAGQAGPDDRVWFMVSGGGSALLCAPAPGITLAQKQAITDHLVRSGAPIAVINTVRRHLSSVKGGRLGALAAARGASLHTLIVSDVVGDDPALVASGPSVPAPFDPDLAIDMLVESGWRCDADLIAAIRANRPAAVPDHPVVTVANGRTALDAVATLARADGWTVVDLGDAVTGEAHEIGAIHADLARSLIGRGGRHLIISGGELTVTAPGRGGCGGPNQEYLAGLALHLHPGDPIAALAGDTDGIDGTEDNAGAFVAAGVLAPEALRRALADHRTHALFAAHGCLVHTGPTLTNVNDLRLVAVES